MQLIALSDSHHNSPVFLQVVNRYRRTAIAFLFAGDGAEDLEAVAYAYPDAKIFAVRGNNDFWLTAMPQNRSLTLTDGKASVRVFMTHGDRFATANRPEKIAEVARAEGATLAIFGHTHLPFAQEINGVLVVNPGSITYPRGGNPATYALITVTDGGEITILHLPVADLL